MLGEGGQEAEVAEQEGGEEQEEGGAGAVG